MLRTLLIVALFTALTTAALAQVKFGTLAGAEEAKIATGAVSKKNQKLCRSKKPDGAVKTWTCRRDQPCCVNHFFNLYTCGSQMLQCL